MKTCIKSWDAGVLLAIKAHSPDRFMQLPGDLARHGPYRILSNPMWPCRIRWSLPRNGAAQQRRDLEPDMPVRQLLRCSLGRGNASSTSIGHVYLHLRSAHRPFLRARGAACARCWSSQANSTGASLCSRCLEVTGRMPDGGGPSVQSIPSRLQLWRKAGQRLWVTESPMLSACPHAKSTNHTARLPVPIATEPKLLVWYRISQGLRIRTSASKDVCLPKSASHLTVRTRRSKVGLQKGGSGYGPAAADPTAPTTEEMSRTGKLTARSRLAK